MIEKYRFYISTKTKKLYFVIACGVLSKDKINQIIFVNGLNGQTHILPEEDFIKHFELYKNE